ncbi:MAG: ethanolamine ammonia-lyase subunit EutC [Oscillospiraceae bacterium]
MPDITSRLTEDVIETEGIRDPDRLRALMEATPARVGIGHAGARCRTRAMLRFLADHAAASDAVFNEVPEEVIRGLDVLAVRTQCRTKQEMLKRPDWGRLFDEDTQRTLREHCRSHVDVQIYFGDGLCSPAVGANVPDLFAAMKAGLEGEGISVGTPFFVRYCRVNTARTIGPLLDAQVVCVLIGERPGLLTAESMSAYIAYRPRPEMQESEYTVVSNISRHGIPPVEAAAYIVEQIREILRLKCSGVAFSEERRRAQEGGRGE